MHNMVKPKSILVVVLKSCLPICSTTIVNKKDNHRIIFDNNDRIRAERLKNAYSELFSRKFVNDIELGDDSCAAFMSCTRIGKVNITRKI